MTKMASGITLAEVGALIGDVARASMLDALMSGRALAASELAWVAGVAAPTASGHLAKLIDGRLVTVERQGRHRYYRIASPLIAELLEHVTAIGALQGPRRHRPASRADEALRTARTCYDHLAGRLGVALADALIARKHVVFAQDGGEVTSSGWRFLGKFGLDLAGAEGQRRCFCRPCLDWSERRSHLAGAVGAALASRCFALGWIERVRDNRAVRITAAGERGFAGTFGVERLATQ